MANSINRLQTRAIFPVLRKTSRDRREHRDNGPGRMKVRGSEDLRLRNVVTKEYPGLPPTCRPIYGADPGAGTSVIQRTF